MPNIHIIILMQEQALFHITSHHLMLYSVKLLSANHTENKSWSKGFGEIASCRHKHTNSS